MYRKDKYACSEFYLYLPLNVTVCKMEEKSPDLVSSMHVIVTVQRNPRQL